MATVKGPLFSLEASGTLGGAVVYSTWKGRSYVRRHVVPANPKAVGQISMRAMLRFLSQAWQYLSDADRADWDTLAAITNISPFNAFLGYNQRRWGINTFPSKQYPATEESGAHTFVSDAATAGVRSVTVSWDVTAVADGWGIAIYSDDASMADQSRNLLLRVVRCEDVQVYEFLHIGLTPGVEQFYRLQSMTDDGKKGIWHAEVSATPTA